MTKTKRAKLKGSGDEFESLFNLLPDFVVVVDRKGKIMAVNDAVEKFGLFKKEELIGKNFLTTGILAAESTPIVTENLAKRMAGAQIPPYQVELARRNGEKIRGEVNATKIRYRGRPANLAIFRNVTERRKTEKALRESEEKLRSVFAASPDAVVISDLRGRIVDCNRAALDLSGASSKEEVIGKDGLTLLASKDRDRASENLKMTLKNGLTRDVEYALLTRDGRKFPAEVSASVIRDSSGTPTGFVVTIRDVTERNRAKEAMKGSQMKLEALHRHARQLSAASSIEEVVKNTLDAMEFTLGFDLAEFKLVEGGCLRTEGWRGRVLSILQMPLDGPGVTVKAANNKRTIRVPDVREEPAFVTPEMPSGKRTDQILSELAVPALVDGEAAAILNVESTRLDAFTDEDQHLLETLAMHVSSALSRLRHVERLKDLVEERSRGLKESEEKFRRIYEASLNAIYTTTIDGQILDMNPAGVSMSGYESLDELRKVNMERVYVDVEDRRRMIELARHGPVRDFATRFRRKDGGIIDVIINSYPLKDESGRIVRFQGAVTDITTRRQMEERLREAEGLAAIGRTAAMVGHDLRNPLQAVASSAHLAKRALQDAEVKGVRKPLETIEKQVRYMDKIVSDLQEYASPLKPRRVETNLRHLIDETITAMTIPENIRVSVRIIEGFPKPAVDPALMRRVFTNLATNALQAMPDGGELTIEASKTEDAAFISFHDTGVGIPEDLMGKLFTPLFTTKAKGQGFGLPVVKRIVEAHNGTITMESSLDKGSTFTVTLPLKSTTGKEAN